MGECLKAHEPSDRIAANQNAAIHKSKKSRYDPYKYAVPNRARIIGQF